MDDPAGNFPASSKFLKNVVIDNYHKVWYIIYQRLHHLFFNHFIRRLNTQWNEDYFIYHAVIIMMTYPPHLRAGITPIKDGMDGMPLYLIRRHTTRFVPTMATPKPIPKNP
jgi:hypothetical protein